jgi:hypothetical protein
MGLLGVRRPPLPLVDRQQPVRVDGALEGIEECRAGVPRRRSRVVHRVEPEGADAAPEPVIAVRSSDHV